MQRTFGQAFLILALLPACSLVVAQKTTFNPSIAIGQGYTDNVQRVGEEETSDTYSDISIELPVVREWATGSLSFRYRPSYSMYGDEESLDHDQHLVDLDWRRELGPKTSIGFAANGQRTQQQGLASISDREDVEDTDLLLTRRTDRDSLGARFSIDRKESARWDWNAAAGWSTREHDAIEDFDETGVPVEFDVEDRTESWAEFGFARALQRSASIGLRYGYSSYDLDDSADESVHSLGFTINHEITRKLNIALTLGGARVSEDGGDDRNEIDGRFRLDRTFRKVSFGLSAAHRPTAGGHLEGTSTNSSLGLSVSGLKSRVWSWDASARFVRRDPQDSDRETTDTTAVGAGIERSFLRSLGLRLGANFVDQSDDGPGSESRSATSASLGLVWYPLGRTALGGGGTP